MFYPDSFLAQYFCIFHVPEYSLTQGPVSRGFRYSDTLKSVIISSSKMSLSWPIPERVSDYFGDYFSFREKAGDSLVSVILSVISLEKAGDSLFR